MSGRITRYDTMFIYELLLGLLVNAYLLHLPMVGWIVLILIGLTFEIITASSWTYCDEFRASAFTIMGTDISVAAAFSWAAVLVICMSLGVALASWFPSAYGRTLFTILTVGFIGNALETMCLRWGMFVYNATWVTRMIVFRAPVFIWGVPLSVRLGYFVIFGPICAVCVGVFLK